MEWTTMHGALRRSDLRAEHLLRREVGAGRMRREHYGVYVDVRHDFDMRARFAAALLRAGSGAHLSHDSAVLVHGLVESSGSVIHISVPAHRRPRPAEGVRFHRPSRLDPADRVLVNGLPVVSVERAVLDRCAAIAEERARVAWVAELIQSGRTTRARLRECVQRSRPVRGCAPLEAALDVLEPGFETIIEAELADICRVAGLHVRAQVTVVLPGGQRHRLDLLDDALLLNPEADGTKNHLSLDALERDHLRDSQLREVGIEAVRFTGRQIRRERMVTTRRLRRVAERRAQQVVRLDPRVSLIYHA